MSTNLCMAFLYAVNLSSLFVFLFLPVSKIILPKEEQLPLKIGLRVFVLLLGSDDFKNTTLLRTRAAETQSQLELKMRRDDKKSIIFTLSSQRIT